jgi:prefoldin subunit 5
MDNRDSNEMYEYMEARIEALKRRIAELERETELLRQKQTERNGDRRRFYAASA